MDIDESGIQRLMPHKIFDGQKVRPIFIEMGTKSMPEGMAGDPMLPSKGSFMGPHKSLDSTLIYIHLASYQARNVSSPFDRIGGGSIE